jgi:diguanylate cyclase (GGDEF)-like protein
MIAGSFLLLILAGPGRLSLDTIKNGYTWSFGSLQILSNICTFAALSVALSATSLTLLTRFSIILSVMLTVFIDHKFKVASKAGFSLILLGIIIVSLSIDAESRAIALFWVFFVCLAKVVRSRIASNHKQNNNATGDFKSEMRVAGYILAITSSMYALVLFITMNLGFNEVMPQVIPSKEQFFALKPFLLAVCVGAVIMASMRYTELISTKHIGGTNFLTVMAFVPMLTFPAQYLLSMIGVIPAPQSNVYELTGGILIILGALLLAQKAVSKTRRTKNKKLAPKARRELQVLRDTVQTAMVCFNDNEELVAQKLGVGKRTIKQIMTTEKEVSKNIRHKIIFNHAQNVAGLDHLTGALNKSSFEAKLKDLENTEKALVLFIDLDKFKPVNDTYGHKAGDSILEGVAERLISEFNTPHVVARLGGDEFCLIVYGKDKKDEEKLIKKVEKLVTEPFIVEGIDDEISVGFSIGSAHYPTEGSCGLELNKVADKRMYEAKLTNGIER